ncbi:MAG: metallophosphatase family protein [Chloroflexota bacterium]|nr:metallophosphatase family protein [Chloroflexota bacterium]
MRIAVIGDVHANLPALRAVLGDIAAIGCDAIWCVGDLVGRGPHPNEVVEEVRRLEIPTVQGNWDEAVGMEREQSGSLWTSTAAEETGHASLDWTVRVMDEDHRAWLRQLPATLRTAVDGRSILLFHGTPLKRNEYLWTDRPSRAFARIASDEGDDLFCYGHTHETNHKLVGQAHFVACGSVGCGAHARARYAVIYLGQPDLAVGFRAVDYDSTGVATDLARAGLPIELLSVPPVPHPLEVEDPAQESA